MARVSNWKSASNPPAGFQRLCDLCNGWLPHQGTGHFALMLVSHLDPEHLTLTTEIFCRLGSRTGAFGSLPRIGGAFPQSVASRIWNKQLEQAPTRVDLPFRKMA
jgi:hypothetical protein